MLRSLLLKALLELSRSCAGAPRLSRGGSRLLTVALVASSSLCGCGSRALRMQMTIAADANGNAPVILSVVFVKSPALQQKVLELSAKQWFAKREQLLRDNRREITESYYEFVPGQQVPQLDYKIASGVSQGILFVNYSGAAPHRYVFETARPVQVSFGPRSVTLTP